MTNTVICTTYEIDLMRHALGVRKRGRKWSKPYRNYYVAAVGTEQARAWWGLVIRGLALCFDDTLPSTTTFQVTSAGSDIVLGLTEDSNA